MRHKVKKLYLGLPRGQRNLLMGNLATSLILHEKVQTTEAKAKALQPIVDKLIGAAKQTDKKAAIRDVQHILQSKAACHKVMQDTIKKYADKNSGFTRITRTGYRAGDAASMVQIELV